VSWAKLWSETWRERAGEPGRPPTWSPAWQYATEYHLTPRNEPMSFVGRHYLEEPYRILTPEFLAHREINFMKSPQVGVSEMMICMILGLAGEMGWRILYILDTFNTRNRFVQDRIDKPLRRVPHYRQMTHTGRGGADNLANKDFGRGVIVFAGSNTEGQFIEYSADQVVNDELDRCDQDNVAMAVDRLQAEGISRGSLVNLSSPTYEGFGIALRFANSTRHRYCRPCPDCGESSEFSWLGCVAEQRDTDFELFDRDWSPELERDIRAYCPLCGAVLDRDLLGEWIPTDPGAMAVGYHIPKLIDGRVQLRAAWEDWQISRGNSRRRELWWNRWPGMPHTEAGSRLTEPILARAAGDYLMPASCDGPCVAGLDVGKGQLHVHVTDESEFPARTVFLGQIPVRLEEVIAICRRYGVRQLVFDADPETNMISAWCEFLRRQRPTIKAWRCRYAEDQLGEMAIDHVEHIVKPDRTMSLDTSGEDFTADVPRVLLPADFRTIDGGAFVEQMGRPVRVIEERRGRAVAVWKKNPPEDYRHAVNYSRVARELYERFGGGSRGTISGGGRVTYGGTVAPPAAPGTKPVGPVAPPKRKGKARIVGSPGNRMPQ